MLYTGLGPSRKDMEDLIAALLTHIFYIDDDGGKMYENCEW